jgi:hypothetical protein
MERHKKDGENCVPEELAAGTAQGGAGGGKPGVLKDKKVIFERRVTGLRPTFRNFVRFLSFSLYKGSLED